MRNLLIGILFGLFISVVVWYGKNYIRSIRIISPVTKLQLSPTPKPLEKYAFENLKKRTYTGSEITIGEKMNETSTFLSYVFYFTSDGKKVSGMINVPNRSGTFPVIVMFRGFVPLEIFETGIGTKHSGEVFAQKGFITLAPDFLGYGKSASPSAKPLEERYETYTTALNLLASIPYLNKTLETMPQPDIRVNPQSIGIWGHSNGGHIALSVLEISGKPYPTVLWAPVSKPFPYSILYYTDDLDDHGKALRRLVANFEIDYDIENYSLTNYFDWIQAPIEIHQGTADDAVPQKWSEELFKALKKRSKDVTYFTYPGDDHNFAEGGWNTVVARNITFYKERLNKPR